MSITPENGGAGGPASLAGVVPQREIRLLVDGVRGWLSQLVGGTGPPKFLGILEGEPGQGQHEVLEALRAIFADLGMRVASGRAFPGASFPPGLIADLQAQLTEPGPGAGALQAAVNLQDARQETGSSLNADLARSHAIDTLSRALVDLGSSEPTLLIAEDLHHADSFTVETLRQVLRMLWLRRERKAPPRLLVVAVLPRAEEAAALLASAGVPFEALQAFCIRARGSTRDDLRELSRRILGEEGQLSFRERVYRVTGGNARHIRWLLWRVREEGGIAAAKLNDSELRLEQLVSERYKALPELQQRLVAMLALLGRDCPAGRVLDLVPLAEERQEAAGAEAGSAVGPAGFSGLLEGLAARDWLVSFPPARGEGERSYAVADHETASVVIEEMGAAARKSLHQELGRAVLEWARADSRWLPHACVHFLGAGMLESCAPLYLDAAGFLEGMGCHAEALDVIEDLLGTRPPLAAEAMTSLRRRQAALLEATGNHREAVDLYRILASGDSTPEEKGRCHRIAGDLYGKLGERASQVKEYGAGLEALEAAGPSTQRLGLLSALARAHLEASNLNLALEHLDRCLELVGKSAEPCREDHREVYRLAEEVHFRRNNYVEAAEFEHCVLKVCEERGDLLGRLGALKHLAHLHLLRGQWVEAETYLREAIATARQTGSRWLLASALCALGLFQRERGEATAAARHLEQARGVFTDLGMTDKAHRITAQMAPLYLELGEFTSAALAFNDYAAEWLALNPSASEPESSSSGQAEAGKRRERIGLLESRWPDRQFRQEDLQEGLLFGDLLAEEARLGEAQRVYLGCLQAALPEDVSSRSRALQALGRIQVLQGDDDAALRWFEQALELQEASPSREFLGNAYLDVGAVFLRRADLSRAHQYVVRGLRLILDGGSTEAILKGLAALGEFLTEMGDSSGAQVAAESCAALARRANLPRWELAAWRLLGNVRVRGLEGRVAEDLMARALELAQALDSPEETCRLKLVLGWEKVQAGCFLDSLALAREGIEVARAVGLHGLLCEFLHLVGVVESAAANPRKNFLRALEALEQAQQGSEMRKLPRLRCEVLQSMSAIYRDRGKHDLAEAYERRARELEGEVRASLPPELKRLAWGMRRRELTEASLRA